MLSARRMVWSPEILRCLVEAYQKDMTPENTWKYIKNNANNHEVEKFTNHFEKKSSRKGIDCEDLIIKRVKNEIASAKQIIPLGEEALYQWINNIGSARTYAWRRQKKQEFLKDKNE